MCVCVCTSLYTISRSHFGSRVWLLVAGMPPPSRPGRAPRGTMEVDASPHATPRWVKRARASSSSHCRSTRRLEASGKRGWTFASLEAVLVCASLPAWWIEFCMKAAAAARSLPSIYGVEVFAGRCELSKAMRANVGPFESYEILLDPKHNTLASSGLELLLQLVFRTVSSGLVWLGTPCKSWVMLSRSWSGRTMARPGGPANASKAQKAYLDEHNAMAEVSSCLVRTAHAVSLRYIVEQPISSLLFSYVRWWWWWWWLRWLWW